MDVLLFDGDARLNVQLSKEIGLSSNMSNGFRRIANYIDYSLVPPFLVSEPSIDVYTTSDETESYFRDGLVSVSLQGACQTLGAMFEPKEEGTTAGHSYLVFYVDGLELRCCVLDFGMLQSLLSIPYKDETAMVSMGSGSLVSPSASVSSFPPPHPPHPPPAAAAAASNTSIFDRVLSKRKNHNLFVMPQSTPTTSTALSSQILGTNEQISQAINKLILSGLRLRGLSGFLSSSSQLSNEKLAVREIYHMTQKCALFAVRKYNYGFNKSSFSIPLTLLLPPPLNIPVHMNDIQDIVENLLLVFIDMEDSNEQRQGLRI